MGCSNFTDQNFAATKNELSRFLSTIYRPDKICLNFAELMFLVKLDIINNFTVMDSAVHEIIEGVDPPPPIPTHPDANKLSKRAIILSCFIGGMEICGTMKN